MPRRRTQILVALALAIVAVVTFVRVRGFGRPSAERGERPLGAGAPPTPRPPPRDAPPLAAPPHARPEPSPRVEGAAGAGVLAVTVKDAQGTGITKARVTAWIDDAVREAETDATGSARIEGIAAGSASVRGDAEGFAGDERDDVAIEAGKVTPVEFVLEAGVAFDGRVVDVRDERPIGGAQVSMEASGAVGGFGIASSRAPFDRTKADAEGAFHVRGVPEGSVATARVRADGYAEGTFSIRILSGRPTPFPLLVRLMPGGRVTGVVHDPNGKPVEGASVYVMPASAGTLRKNPRMSTWSSDGSHSEAASVRSGKDGAYAVEGLPLDDAYVAVAYADAFARSAEATDLRLDLRRLEARADLVVRAPASLDVRIVDLDGKPVLEAVAVQVGEFLGGARKTAPDDANAYRFEGLNVGPTTITVTAPSFRPASASVVLDSGTRTETVVRLDPGAAVEGVVVDEDGKPVPEATVSVAPAEANPTIPAFDAHVWYLVDARERTTDEKGRFRIAGLAPGPVVLGASTQAAETGVWRPRDVVRTDAPAKDVRLVLVRLGWAIVRFVTPEGTPFAGLASVLYAKHGEGRGGGSETVKDGRVLIHALPTGAVDVDIRLAGFAPFRRTFEARLGAEVDLGEVRLDLGVEVRGRVADLEGRPLVGTVFEKDHFFDGVATDAQGRFVLEHVARGPLRIEARADGFLEGEVEAEAGRQTEFRLARGALVRGRVADSEGKPAADARLVARRLGDDGTLRSGSDEYEWDAASDDGRVTWRLAAGRWRILVGQASGEEAPLGEWTFAEGEVRDLTLTLPKR